MSSSLSYSSILRIIFVLIVLAFLYFIRDLILVLFLSMVLASALDPWVSWFERRGMPRGVGMATIYVLLFAFLGVLGVLVVPSVLNQIQVLAKHLPELYSQVSKFLESTNSPFFKDIIPKEGDIQSLSQILTTFASEKLIPLVRNIFGGGVSALVNGFFVLVFTFYLSVEDRGLKRFFRSFLPDQYQPYFTQLMNRIQGKIGQWFRGQLVLSLVIFVITAVILFIINLITHAVPFWLVLALIAGALEIIPFIGPLISVGIAIFLIIGNSFWSALVVLIAYMVVQQVENHILVPKIMQKTVGLNPLVVILVVIIGGRLAGIIGAIIAIPVAAAIQVVLSDVVKKEGES